MLWLYQSKAWQYTHSTLSHMDQNPLSPLQRQLIQLLLAVHINQWNNSINGCLEKAKESLHTSWVNIIHGSTFIHHQRHLSIVISCVHIWLWNKRWHRAPETKLKSTSHIRKCTPLKPCSTLCKAFINSTLNVKIRGKNTFLNLCSSPYIWWYSNTFAIIYSNILKFSCRRIPHLLNYLYQQTNVCNPLTCSVSKGLGFIESK
jgi:hypothetical protein